MELEISIIQNLTDGKTCNLYDVTIYEPNTGDNATAILKNTVGTTISTTVIPAGGTDIIIAPDATAVIKNTQGTTIDTEAIPSSVSEDIVLPDEDYEVYVNGVFVDSGSFPVYGNATIDINL